MHIQRAHKILVIDEDDATANLIAAAVPQGSCEIIACRDMALAEVATDLTEFDLILVAPCSTGLDGIEGFDAATFLEARNPTALAALMVANADGDLKTAALQRGSFPVVSRPPLPEEILPLLGVSQPGLGAA